MSKKKKAAARKQVRSENDKMHFEDLNRLESAVVKACDQLKKDWKTKKAAKIKDSGSKLLLLMGEYSYMINEFKKLKAQSR